METNLTNTEATAAKRGFGYWADRAACVYLPRIASWVAFVAVWLMLICVEILHRVMWMCMAIVNRSNYTRRKVEGGNAFADWYIKHRDVFMNLGSFWVIKPVAITRETVIVLIGGPLGAVLMLMYALVVMGPFLMTSASNAMRRM